MYDCLAQGTFRPRWEATDGAVEVNMVAEAYLSQCGTFADDVGLRPKSATAYGTVVLLEVGDALCDGPVFLMPSEVPEMSDLSSPARYPLLGELPHDGAVLCGGPPLRWGVPLCSGAVTVFRVGVEGGMVESAGEAAQQGGRSHCGPDPVMGCGGAFGYCLMGDRSKPMKRGEVGVVVWWLWAFEAFCWEDTPLVLVPAVGRDVGSFRVTTRPTELDEVVL